MISGNETLYPVGMFKVPDVPIPEQERFLLELAAKVHAHSDGGWGEIHIMRSKTHDRVRFVCHCDNNERLTLGLTTFVHNIPEETWKWILLPLPANGRPERKKP